MRQFALADRGALWWADVVSEPLPYWTRRNGDVTLAIQPGINIRTGKSYGYPYGTIPRLLLFWITTEAVRIRSRRLELGNSLNGFMAELGLNPDTGGGMRQTTARPDGTAIPIPIQPGVLRGPGRSSWQRLEPDERGRP